MSFELVVSAMYLHNFHVIFIYLFYYVKGMLFPAGKRKWVESSLEKI